MTAFHVRVLAIASLVALPLDLRAQVLRNGPEWGGMDHQPTEAEVLEDLFWGLMSSREFLFNH